MEPVAQITLPLRRHPVLIWSVVILHLGWALLLIRSDTGLSTTPVNTIYHHVAAGSQPVTVGILLLSAIAAMWSMLNHDSPVTLRVSLLIPQQAVLVMSAMGGLFAAWQGAYADGVPRPFEFIMTDQLLYLVIAVGYTISIVDYFTDWVRWIPFHSRR